MKLVKESLEFKRGLNPKEAMNIGIFSHKDFESRDEMNNWVANNLTTILRIKKFPEDILNDTTHEGDARMYIHPAYYTKLGAYFQRYMDANIHPEEFHKFLKRKYPNLKSWLKS
jgi:hypothetical protein